MTLGGYLGDHPPTDEAGYIEFARSLPKPEIFEVIKDAEPLTSLTSYQFSANLRRHYEELSRFLEGFWCLATPCAVSIRSTARG